jgi:hypothetical protein
MTDGLEKYEALAQELLGDDDEAAFAIRELIAMVRAMDKNVDVSRAAHARAIERAEAAEQELECARKLLGGREE